METLTLPDAVRETLRERSRPLASPYGISRPFILDALKITTAELPRDMLLSPEILHRPQAPERCCCEISRSTSLPTPVNGSAAQTSAPMSAGRIDRLRRSPQPTGRLPGRRGESIRSGPVEREASAHRARARDQPRVSTRFQLQPGWAGSAIDRRKIRLHRPIVPAAREKRHCMPMHGVPAAGPEHEACWTAPLQFAVSYSFSKRGSDRPWSVASPVLTGPAAFGDQCGPALRVASTE